MSYPRLILKLVTCAAVALFTLELCARLDDYFAYGASILKPYQIEQIYEFDSLGRRGKPNAQFRKWKLNSLGYRGPEPRTGTERIVVFGASETFGLYESPDHEFPRLLEHQLNERNERLRFDVINTAYAGMPISAMIQRVPEIADTVRPRFGIIYPTPANYIWLPWLKGVQKPTPLPAFDLRLREQVRTMAKAITPTVLQNWLRQRDIDASSGAYGQAMERVPNANIDRFADDLRALAEALRERGAQPILLTHANRFHDPPTVEDKELLVAWRRFYPMLNEAGFMDMERRMNNAILELGRAQGYTVVDIARTVPPGSKYFADFTHFTDEGSSLVADAVASALLPIVTTCCETTAQVAGRHRQ